MINKKYSAYIRFGSEKHDEVEDWCINNNTTMSYDNGVLACQFPSKDIADKFSMKFPSFVEL